MCLPWLERYTEALEKNKNDLIKKGGSRKESQILDKTYWDVNYFSFFTKLF